MKMVEHYGNIGWKVHELAWNLYEIETTRLWNLHTKGVNWTKCRHSKFISDALSAIIVWNLTRRQNRETMAFQMLTTIDLVYLNMCENPHK
jgi:hypothetical protein